MKKRLYRITIVFWQDSRNPNTDYIADFRTKKHANDYVKKHRDYLTRKALKLKSEDDFAVDLDIELWSEDNYIGVVYSTQLWRKIL